MRSGARVVVAGAGVGGLAAAIDLAAAGLRVTLLERAPAVGGKMREVEVGGRAIDAGPTVLTMRRVFDDLFADAGADLQARLPLAKADVLARHAWADGSRLDLFADVDRSTDAVAAFAGPAEGRRFRAFCDLARRVYEEVEGPFIFDERPTMARLLAEAGAGLVGRLRRIDAGRTMWRALQASFTDPRLHQLFGRYATYCGSSPFLAPATLNLVFHVERSGVYLVPGGMYRLAEALAGLARELGVEVRCGAPVERVVVERRRAAGVVLAGGERLEADAVVCNAGVAALAGGHLGRDVARAVDAPHERSLSAVTWATVARSEGFPLAFHNVFFSDDPSDEFDALFARRRLPERPTVYVCAQDRAAGDPAGPERLFVLVNAPADGDRGLPRTDEVDACEVRTMRWLERCGLTWTPGPTTRTTPADFEAMFPGTGGALYGAATHGWRASLRRAGSRTRLPGLYLAGGGAHPGAGVPMAALSGRLAARAVLADLRTTSIPARTATHGGTSTSSTPDRAWR
jgi:1-hydroxycarotenoid 3,4-desaturase